jgi:leucine dehydrogenase
MNVLEAAASFGHEQIVFCHDAAADYKAIIAIHSTVLGPAGGGTRLLRYASEEDALRDALRLSRGMTYKNAVAGLPLGGGKAVILANGGHQDRERLFRAHGRFVERFGGRFITGEDVGTSVADMDFIRQETKNVTGLAHISGDPSPWTARGVLRAIQASARQRWGSESLAAKTVAIQGCGNVGFHLARLLAGEGARLVIADVDPQRVRQVVQETSAEAVEPEAIYDAKADVFAPCALGGAINDETLPRLKVGIVAGAANNQLLEDRHGRALEDRGILYAPDFVANAGGVISSTVDLLGWTQAQAAEKIDAIYDTVLSVFSIAGREGIPTSEAANRLAEERLRAGRPRT